MEAKWQHPWTSVISEATGSGKSCFVQKLVNHIDTISDTQFARIILHYPEWQNGYKELGDRVEFREGLPEMSDYTCDPRPKFLIVDDLMHESSSSDSLASLFTKGSHHRGLSIIYITQNIHHQGKGQRDISLNAHYIVICRNLRDRSQIQHLSRQLMPEIPKFLQEAYWNATSRPYGDWQERPKTERSDQQKPIDHDIDQSIIESVPVKLHSKAKRLLRRLKAAGGISWDSTGTVSIDGACIRGASILDLVNYCMRARKQSPPPGHLQFAAILRRAGIPREYIGYRSLGPGTKLAERLERGEVSVCPLDDYAREHDIAYANKNADRRKANRVLAERAFSRMLASQVDPDGRKLALMTACCMVSKITFEKLFSRITKAITRNKKKNQAKKKKEPTKTPADADGKKKKKEKK
ncbi:hypothetical protein QAD02_013065 [Eretmocerus hayati]|uniref:Uncharacterized protein n=1 Tax=Eretmocerus hayati TaxID=131215 RepID=A0ACC2P2G5_9HYME|nr:hypothetical protein QAD02_013065 [Eretmocerus hayati]